MKRSEKILFALQALPGGASFEQNWASEFTGDFAHEYDLEAIERDYTAAVTTAVETFVDESDESMWESPSLFDVRFQVQDHVNAVVDSDAMNQILERHDLSGATSGAAFAAELHLMGLTPTNFGEVVTNAEGKGVDPRRVRQWHDGDRSVPAPIWARLRELRVEHDALVADMRAACDAGLPVRVAAGPLPAGWYRAAAARLRGAASDARINWA